MARTQNRNVIARFPEGEVEGVVFLKMNAADGFRYPAWDLERIAHSPVTGKRLPNKDDFFEYNLDDAVKAARAAVKFIARYKVNPDAAMAEVQARQTTETAIAA